MDDDRIDPFTIVGEVNLELGVYFEFQIQPDGSQQRAFQTDLSHIELADRLGYDYAWLAELHFSPERSVMSSPFLAACAAIHRTKKIRIGTAVSVLPFNNPVRIAEDVATLDHHPEVIETCKRRNCEFFSHVIYNARYLYGMSEAQERNFIEDVNKNIKNIRVIK